MNEEKDKLSLWCRDNIIGEILMLDKEKITRIFNQKCILVNVIAQLLDTSKWGGDGVTKSSHRGEECPKQIVRSMVRVRPDIINRNVVDIIKKTLSRSCKKESNLPCSCVPSNTSNLINTEESEEEESLESLLTPFFFFEMSIKFVKSTLSLKKKFN